MKRQQRKTNQRRRQLKANACRKTAQQKARRAARQLWRDLQSRAEQAIVENKLTADDLAEAGMEVLQEWMSTRTQLRCYSPLGILLQLECPETAARLSQPKLMAQMSNGVPRQHLAQQLWLDLQRHYEQAVRKHDLTIEELDESLKSITEGQGPVYDMCSPVGMWCRLRQLQGDGQIEIVCTAEPGEQPQWHAIRKDQAEKLLALAKPVADREVPQDIRRQVGLLEDLSQGGEHSGGLA